jgi:hypothetical protein
VRTSVLVTSEGSPCGRFARALDRRNLAEAEAAARELEAVTLEDARQLVDLYGECGSPKFERAALRWLQRYVEESRPALRDLALVTASLADRVST